MGIKENQKRVRQALRDTIKLLCKNGLSYKSEFSVEGLLGITIDNQDIFLVNINEVFENTETASSGRDNESTVTTPLKGQSLSSSRYNAGISPYGRNSFGKIAMGYTFSGLRKMRRKSSIKPDNQRQRSSVPHLGNYVNSSVNVNNSSKSQLSEDITDNNFVSSNIFSDPSSTAEVSGTVYVAEEASGETSGKEALRRLEDCVGRIERESPEGAGNNCKEDMVLGPAGEELSITVKEEVFSDTEAIIQEDIINAEEITNSESDMKIEHAKTSSNRRKKHSFADADNSASVSWFSIADAACGKPVFPAFSASTEDVPIAGGLVTPQSPSRLVSMQQPAFPVGLVKANSPTLSRRGNRFVDLETRDRAKDAACEYFAIRSPGCVVIGRMLCRAKGFKVNNVMHAMRAMTRRRDDPLYIGEYKQISGNMKTYYKCPPELIQDEALVKYDLTRDMYISLYYQNPRPKMGGPTNWPNYVDMLMRHMPLGPKYFPTESMGLSNEELNDIQNKQSGCPTLENPDYFACIGHPDGRERLREFV